MAKNLTKTAVSFNDFRISRTRISENETKYYISVGYDVLTSEGEIIHRDEQAELTGGAATTAVNLFGNIEDKLKQKEGI